MQGLGFWVHLNRCPHGGGHVGAPSGQAWCLEGHQADVPLNVSEKASTTQFPAFNLPVKLVHGRRGVVAADNRVYSANTCRLYIIRPPRAASPRYRS